MPRILLSVHKEDKSLNHRISSSFSTLKLQMITLYLHMDNVNLFREEIQL